MNAIELLMQDHKEVAGMMDQLETADKGDRSARDTFLQLKNALTMHTQIEEQVFYPALKNHEETRDMIPESLDEHQEVDQILAEMSSLSPGNDDFMDRLTELRDAIEHHVEEEENEMFPKAERILGETRIQEMGRQMQQMKQGKSATAINKQM
ncbi:MAG TPA: hemerythrin domain-containing protein [Blastocatellia bacterium]|jgi:hemerythrin superfamily protein|nr:hemerythrin domain-containing protein [Blastocatellia bacterium]